MEEALHPLYTPLTHTLGLRLRRSTWPPNPNPGSGPDWMLHTRTENC